MHTGEWVRRAARGEGVVITERGRPVASLIPFEEGHAARSFRERHVLPEFDSLPEISGDATAYVSEDRDRRFAAAPHVGMTARDVIEPGAVLDTP